MKGNKKKQACEHLKRLVLTLKLAPAESLDENRLCEQFNLSRTPLREVFQKLAGEGYITLEANKGASVSPMDLQTMRNFFQTAPMIYAAVARLAAEQASTAQIAALKKTQAKFSVAVKRRAVTDMAMYNHLFHEHLGEMANSPYLAPSLRRLLIDHTRMSYRFYRIDKTAVTNQRTLQACDQHQGMIEAIEQHNAPAVVELTIQHWELSRTEIDKYVCPDPFPIDAAPPSAELG